MSIALKVFCVGVTFGGASGLAPMIPTANFGGDSSLGAEDERRMRWGGEKETLVCFIEGLNGEQSSEASGSGKRYILRVQFVKRGDNENIDELAKHNCKSDRFVKGGGFWIRSLGETELDKGIEKAKKSGGYDEEVIGGHYSKMKEAWSVGSRKGWDTEPASARILVVKNVKELDEKGTGIVNK